MDRREADNSLVRAAGSVLMLCGRTDRVSLHVNRLRRATVEVPASSLVELLEHAWLGRLFERVMKRSVR
jgi:hypothetical protein